MYHGCIIYTWKVAIDEIKFVQTKQSGPNSLDLNVSEVLSNTAMTAGAKRNVGELLPSCRVVPEIAVRLEVQGVLPGVLQALVNGGGHADLMAGGNVVSCDGLGSFGQSHNGHYRRSKP